MKYEVIRYFTDAQDNEYAYHEGDMYPRDGLIPSEQRIKDLMTGNNFQKVALIQYPKGKMEKPKKEEPKKEVKEDKTVWTAEEINKMPFMKLKSVAKQNEVEVDGRTAAEIREDLIKKIVEE